MQEPFVHCVFGRGLLQRTFGCFAVLKCSQRFGIFDPQNILSVLAQWDATPCHHAEFGFYAKLQIHDAMIFI